MQSVQVFSTRTDTMLARTQGSTSFFSTKQGARPRSASMPSTSACSTSNRYFQVKDVSFTKTVRRSFPHSSRSSSSPSHRSSRYTDCQTRRACTSCSYLYQAGTRGVAHGVAPLEPQSTTGEFLASVLRSDLEHFEEAVDSEVSELLFSCEDEYCAADTLPDVLAGSIYCEQF
jgi:hypothetical protein